MKGDYADISVGPDDDGGEKLDRLAKRIGILAGSYGSGISLVTSKGVSYDLVAILESIVDNFEAIKVIVDRIE